MLLCFQAHQQTRQAERCVNAGKYDDAIRCHQAAAGTQLLTPGSKCSIWCAYINIKFVSFYSFIDISNNNYYKNSIVLLLVVFFYKQLIMDCHPYKSTLPITLDIVTYEIQIGCD